MHEPYAFPSERLECLDIPDSTDTASSGALVPKPITTIPTISGDTPSARAILAAAAMNRSALHPRAASPPAMNTRESQSEMSLLRSSTFRPF